MLRELSKINDRIHTDAVKEFLITTLSPQEMAYPHASEADILNMALFGKTAAQWRKELVKKRLILEILHRRKSSLYLSRRIQMPTQ